MSDGSLIVKEIRKDQFGIFKCKVNEKITTYKVLRLTGENFQLFNVAPFENPKERRKEKERSPVFIPCAPFRLL